MNEIEDEIEDEIKTADRVPLVVFRFVLISRFLKLRLMYADIRCDIQT